MSDQPAQLDAPILRMPDRESLVKEAIARFDALDHQSGRASNVLQLDTRSLETLGMLLTDRKLSITDAHKAICAELGWVSTGKPEVDGEPPVNYQAINRWAPRFRKVYAQVRGENAKRIARLSVETATLGNIQTMSRVAHARLTEMMTEKLIDSDGLEDMTPAEINSILSAIDGVNIAQLKREELALKIADSERKNQQLEADLKLSDLKAQKLQSDLDDLKAKVDAQLNSMKAASGANDGAVPASVIDAAREAIFGKLAGAGRQP